MSDRISEITCKEVLNLLDEYRRKTLAPNVLKQIDAHLQSCDSCSAELAARESLAQQLRASLPAVRPPSELPAAVRTTIRQSQRQSEKQSRRGGNLLSGMLAAAVIIISAVALIQIRPLTEFKETEIASGVERQRQDNYFKAAEPAGQTASAPASKQEAAPASPMQALSEYTTLADRLEPSSDAPSPPMLPPPQLNEPPGTERKVWEEQKKDQVYSRVPESAALTRRYSSTSALVPAEDSAPADTVSQTRQETSLDSVSPATYIDTVKSPASEQPRPASYALQAGVSEDDLMKDKTVTNEARMAGQPPRLPAVRSGNVSRLHTTPTSTLSTTGTITTPTLTTATQVQQATSTLETTSP